MVKLVNLLKLLMCFVVFILLAISIWHMTLRSSEDIKTQRGIKENVLKSYVSYAISPIREDFGIITRYILPSSDSIPAPLSVNNSNDARLKKTKLPDFRSMYPTHYFSTVSGVYIDENETDVFLVTPHHENVQDRGYCLIRDSTVGVNFHKKALREYNVRRYSNIEIDIRRSIHEFSGSDCAIIQSRMKDDIHLQHDTLLVFTTCNHLEVTILAINSLESGKDKYDILVVDDYSIDGTADYLIKQGYAVITKDKARGLTHSWNIGYRVAKELGYRYVMFANNDVLVPPGTIDMMRKVLVDEALVVPLTTELGAGHNPAQSLMYSHNLAARKADYVDDPAHTEMIQAGLSKIYRRSSDHLVVSKWMDRIKFNGFFFAVNIHEIATSAYDKSNLFDPDAIMVDQEDRLMTRMTRNNKTPKICRFAFVFHFKSVTVKASNYVMGSKVETRNNLSFYHPELQTDVAPLAYPELYSTYPTSRMTIPTVQLYPNDHRPVVIGIAVSNPATNPSAGDIYTATEIGNALDSRFNVKIVYLHRSVSWYDVEELDIVISFLDPYDLTQIRKAKPSLIVVAWMRNWFHRWLSRKWIGNYDLLLTSSLASAEFFRSFSTLPVQCHMRCPPLLALDRKRSKVEVDVLRIATNPLRFSPGNASLDFSADFVFTGNYWDVFRELMAFDPLNISEFKGVVVGSNWEQAPVSTAWKKMVHGPVPYRLMPQVYRSSKIVIDDANHVTKPWGSVNSRVFDALACGTLVITNGALGSEDVFDLELPTYTNMDDLTEKLRFYLTHDDIRESLVKRLQQKVCVYCAIYCC